MAKMNMTLTVDASELKKLLAEFTEMIDRKEAKINELEKRIEAIEKCPAICTDI